MINFLTLNKKAATCLPLLFFFTPKLEVKQADMIEIGRWLLPLLILSAAKTCFPFYDHLQNL